MFNKLMNGFNKAYDKLERGCEMQSAKLQRDYRDVCSQIRFLQGNTDTPEKEEKLRMLERKKAYLEEQIEKFQSQGF